MLDDWQGVATDSADWLPLAGLFDVFAESFADEDEAAEKLRPYNVLVPMRERTAIPASLIARLPNLRLIAMTGSRSATLDVSACTSHGVMVCTTEGQRSSAGTAELTLGLIIGASRGIAEGDAAIRAGRFQQGVPVGPVLEGRTLGIVGLGRIGARVAGYGRALGMRVLAWSRSLTPDAAAVHGAEQTSLPALLAASHVVSLHVPLTPASRGLIGPRELAQISPGALLVNTSRSALVDQPALLHELTHRRIRAALDVYDREPLPIDDPIRTAPNTLLTPHIGYGTADAFRQFYRDSVENILAYRAGNPIRVLNPEVRPGM